MHLVKTLLYVPRVRTVENFGVSYERLSSVLQRHDIGLA